jgi:hypothetical protein
MPQARRDDPEREGNPAAQFDQLVEGGIIRADAVLPGRRE